jgi:hypothetical protein
MVRYDIVKGEKNDKQIHRHVIEKEKDKKKI